MSLLTNRDAGWCVSPKETILDNLNGVKKLRLWVKHMVVSYCHYCSRWTIWWSTHLFSWRSSSKSMRVTSCSATHRKHVPVAPLFPFLFSNSSPIRKQLICCDRSWCNVHAILGMTYDIIMQSTCTLSWLRIILDLWSYIFKSWKFWIEIQSIVNCLVNLAYPDD